MSEPPWLWLLAGPNGAGKSTFAPNLSASVEEIVGPDAVADELLPTAPEKAALSAGRQAVHFCSPAASISPLASISYRGPTAIKMAAGVEERKRSPCSLFPVPCNL